MEVAGLVTVWHNGEPPAIVAQPPARRYRCDDAPLQHLAWHEGNWGQTRISNPLNAKGGSEAGAEWPKLESDPNFEVMSFRLMRDVGRVSQPDTPWLYIVHTDIPEHIVDEYNEWYDKEHLPRLVTVPGVIRARRYTAVAGNPRYLTAYELTERDAFESPEGLQARKTPWTAKMRSLFENTRRRMCRLIAP